MDGKGWRFSAKNFLIIVILLSAIIALPKTASAAQLTLTWKDSSNNEDGFEVERKTGTTGTFAIIATKGPNTTSHIDSNLPSGTTYCYRVRAFNAAGNSAYSNDACGTTASSQTFTLTVTKTGSGSGTVTSSPAGINCGSTCSATYTGSTTVTLTATPASGSTFAGWSGGCSGTGNCTVITNANVTITATFTTASSSPTTSPTGLVAAYSFNEGKGNTVTDASGNNHTGTLSGATWTTAGKFGAALTFNGTNNWVTINDANALDLTTGMTLEAWVFPTAGSGWRVVMMKEQANNLVYALYAFSDQDGPGASGWLATGGTWGSVVAKTTTPLNAWTHLATTYDGTRQRLYVNGAEVANRAQTGPMPNSTGPLRIGGNSVWGEYFQGRIDNVRLYNRALTASEIQANMGLAIETTPSSSPQTYTLSVAKSGSGSGTVSSNPAGISCGSTCSATYPSGTAVTLTAAPASGSTFAGWSNGGCSGTGTCTVIVNANTSVTATFTASTTASKVVFAVNAGGSPYTAPDGTVYKADTAFSGGSTYKVTASIAGTDEDPLYQSERYGNFTYNVPVANGTYAVTLKFAEIYWSAAGQRIFDVLLEGKEVISNMDLFARVGKNKAYDITSTVKVTDGVLNMRFRPDVNNAKVSAIKVVFVSN